ncbi:SDR family NAD(P)-dependent oxidoreductase [Variovorax paradoxus]|jgi:NAD(P)-dependent dehydrogenase (short-subunit alcohol dehydrogenase family)|uniref:SDR family NAD(P)-dependent oxidoreductase n=1 Tax=Variovorax paradoxus TaxID=34073 RepID=UPI003ED103FB
MKERPTIVVTGATSGIGEIASIELAKRGAHLVLTARDKAKASRTLGRIRAEAPGAHVDFHYADFGSVHAVAAVATEIAARYDRIDVLINNAGLHAFEQRVTGDGFAEMIAVNYLAPWLFTDILRDALIRSAPSRVVTVASEASRRSGGLTPDKDLVDTSPFTRAGSSKVYGKTKLMDIMFSLELARQLEGTGVTAHCLDPGFNVTGLGRELGFAEPLAKVLKWLGVGDPRRGAEIIVRLATEDTAPTTGGYFSVKNARPLNPSAPADDAAARHELWIRTRSLLSERLETIGFKQL